MAGLATYGDLTELLTSPEAKRPNALQEGLDNRRLTSGAELW
jgi:hypothetical protein